MPEAKHAFSNRFAPTLLVGAVAILLVIGVAVTQTQRETDVDRLMAMPERSLVYPGSTLLIGGGSSENSQSPAEAWQHFGTDASIEQILAFYTDKLAARGFDQGAAGSITRLTTERRACGWHKADLVVRVGFWYPEAHSQRFPDVPVYPTTYEVRLQERTVDPAYHNLCTWDGLEGPPPSPATP